MSQSAALLILVICAVLALLIAAPFLYLSRRRRRRLAPEAAANQEQVPLRSLPGILAYVAVLFFGFTYAYTEPSTWFGQQMKTDIGRLSFFLVPLLIVVVVNYLWSARKRK